MKAEPRIVLRGKEAEQYRKNFREIDWSKDLRKKDERHTDKR